MELPELDEQIKSVSPRFPSQLQGAGQFRCRRYIRSTALLLSLIDALLLPELQPLFIEYSKGFFETSEPCFPW